MKDNIIILDLNEDKDKKFIKNEKNHLKKVRYNY